MADDKEVLDRLDRYAKAIARIILCKFDLEYAHDRAEDIAQDLYVAGWLVWKDTGKEGLAKHRMSDRGKNATQKLARELEHEPRRPFSADRINQPANHQLIHPTHRRPGQGVQGTARSGNRSIGMEAVVDKSPQAQRVGKFVFDVVIDEGDLSPDEVAEHRARRTEALTRWLLARWQREQQDFRNN